MDSATVKWNSNNNQTERLLHFKDIEDRGMSKSSRGSSLQWISGVALCVLVVADLVRADDPLDAAEAYKTTEAATPHKYPGEPYPKGNECTPAKQGFVETNLWNKVPGIDILGGSNFESQI